MRCKNKIHSEIFFEDNNECVDWLTQPSIGEDGNIRFHFTDACHILTCLRTKICTTGISGLRKEAWEMAALSKDTMLNVSIVLDCIDKQDVALARRMFDKDVEECMERNGIFFSEAEFCRLIRNWFDAEDEPSIPALTRCHHRLKLRHWFLSGYPVGYFPPPTQYVRGIPIVTYEGLLAHVERKLQLHALVPEYNARATGSQEVEQFFSTFRDMDPAGNGTPKPDSIPGMMEAVVEIDSFRLDPNKPFYIKTSRAAVYPSVICMAATDTASNHTKSNFSRKHEGVSSLRYNKPRPFTYRTGRAHKYHQLEKSKDLSSECDQNCAACVSRSIAVVTDITIKDHFFDHRKGSKKKGGIVDTDINSLQKGALCVRWEKARRNESKILVTSKMGLTDVISLSLCFVYYIGTAKR